MHKKDNFFLGILYLIYLLYKLTLQKITNMQKFTPCNVCYYKLNRKKWQIQKKKYHVFASFVRSQKIYSIALLLILLYKDWKLKNVTCIKMMIFFAGISTLLCYLELHSLRWIENLVNVYGTCKVQCYGGPSQLQAVSQKVNISWSVNILF